MTDKYQIYPGWDMAGSLVDMIIQPSMPGQSWPSREMAGDLLTKPDGFKHCQLIFDFMSIAQRVSFETQAGLSETVESARVTVRVPRNSDRAFTNYNAVITSGPMPDDIAFKFGKYNPITYYLDGMIEIT